MASCVRSARMGTFRDWFRSSRPLAQRATETTSAALVPSPREGGRGVVSSSEALGLSAVYRAVSIRATAAKQLSIDVFRGDTAMPTPAWIRRPDIGTPRHIFVERTITSLNLAGNAYWRIRRDPKNAVQSLEVLNPHDVIIDAAASGRITGYQYHGHTLSADEVKHLSRLRVPGTPYGLGPIQAAAAEMRGALDLRDYASNWITSGDVPSGVLKSDQALTPEQAAAARDAWSASRGGKRGVAVLGNGLAYTPVVLSPEDAQFIQSQNLSVVQVARLFGVPASLMLVSLEGNSQSYANVEQDWIGFARFGLADDLIEIEEALSDLLPFQRRARFNIDALLRTDTSTRYAAHKTALEAGFLTVNEVRAIENLPPLPEAEEATAA